MNMPLDAKSASKVSDIVIDAVARAGVRTIFGIVGGASLHLLNSVVKHPELELVTTHHEQASAMAADSYARVSRNLGVAIATSGPGATNLLTGIAGCFYDSIPTVFITGQVSTTRQSGSTGTRQIGFQETPIVNMVGPITKYAVQLTDPRRAREEIERCLFIARDGRPGPTLIDIPDDIQRMLLSETDFSNFQPSSISGEETMLPAETNNQLSRLVREAKRPIFICGSGIHLAGKESLLQGFLAKVGWPTLLTWGAADLLTANDSVRVGTFGTHGSRIGNFTAQNADLIISIGSRLDTKATGSPVSSFAPMAKIVMFDVDETELNKFASFDKSLELKICLNLRDESFLQALKTIEENSNKPDEWLQFIRNSEKSLNENRSAEKTGVVEPYRFVETLSNAIPSGSRVFIDTGCAIAWTMQAWKIKTNTRLFHDFNNTAMGWALPAVIGSLAENRDILTFAIIGDGSFMMSIQELATLKSLPGKACIFIINNSGYSMIKQTQDQWFEGVYFASNADGHMHFPDFRKVSEAFGLNYEVIDSEERTERVLQKCIANQGSTLCEVIVSPQERVVPQVKFGHSIEDMDPALTSAQLSRYLLNGHHS